MDNEDIAVETPIGLVPKPGVYFWFRFLGFLYTGFDFRFYSFGRIGQYQLGGIILFAERLLDGRRERSSSFRGRTGMSV